MAGGGKGGAQAPSTRPQVAAPNAPTPGAAGPANITQGQAPNMFQQSANSVNAGMAGAASEMGFTPQQVGTDFGYTPTNVGTDFGYDPQDVNAQTAAGGIQTYMNPYTQQVIDTSMADLERQRQTQMNQMGAQASAAGAFGGSREGVAQSLTNEAFARQGGQLASGLRQQGFQTALGASQQDVSNQLQADLANQQAGARAQEFGQSTGLQADLANQQAGARANEFGQSTALQAQLANQQAQLAGSQQRLNAGQQLANIGNLGFTQANTINQQQQQQGLAMQALNQQLIDAARQQYAGFTGAPNASLQLPMSAVTAGNMGQGTTTGTATKNPGLFDCLTLGANTAAGFAQSDPRLKTNVKPLEQRGDIQFYSWDWTDEGARRAHPDQPTVGVMADEVQVTHPHLVRRDADGYLAVDYGGLAAELGAV